MNREQIESAALKVGVRVDMKRLNEKGSQWQVKVNLGDTIANPGDRKKDWVKVYQRRSAGYQAGRKVNAVCWHGFRDFFRACFEMTPDAKFTTALDTWKGSEDFEARYRNSGWKNIGSQMFPTCAAEACDCGEGAY